MSFNVPSNLSTSQPYIGLVTGNDRFKVAGMPIAVADMTALAAYLVIERSNITATLPITLAGTSIRVATEPEGVYRRWNASGSGDAKTVAFPGGKTVTMGSDTATVRTGSGTPSSGLGSDGDYYIDALTNGLIGPKASGAWPATSQTLTPGSGSIAKILLAASRTLTAADMGYLLESQVAGAVALSIDTVANTSGLVWSPGRYFFLGAAHTSSVATTGAVTMTALSGVTITNVGTLAVVMDASPLVVMMSPDLNRWHVQ